MNLFDVFYHGTGMDKYVSLDALRAMSQEKRAEVDYAACTNWSNYILRPVSVGGALRWQYADGALLSE